MVTIVVLYVLPFTVSSEVDVIIEWPRSYVVLKN
jgi:hypothetical protein